MRYRVEEIRKEQNMTQSELARASGISRATVAALESGKEIVVKRIKAANLYPAYR